MKEWLRKRIDDQQDAGVIRPRFEGTGRRDFSVAGYIETPKGIPIVSKPYIVDHDGYSTRAFRHKLPGGGGEPGEYPYDAFIREILEELGIVINPNDVKFLYYEDRGNHDFYVFKSTSGDEPSREFTDDGERVNVIPPDKLLEGLSDLPEQHGYAIRKELLKKCGISGIGGANASYGVG